MPSTLHGPSSEGPLSGAPDHRCVPNGDTPCRCPRCGWLGTFFDTRKYQFTDSDSNKLQARNVCPHCSPKTSVQQLRQKGLDALRQEHALLLKPGFQARGDRGERRDQIERFFERIGQPPLLGPITVPATTPLHYLGGMAALNLPSPTGTGDWHMEQTFFRQREKRSRSFISGVGCPTDTTSMLSDAGIYDCTAMLDELGIPHESAVAYAASHARACADLVLSAVMHDRPLDFVTLDDWMPRDSDKQQVFDLLAKALDHLTAEQKDKVLQWQRRNAL